MLSTRGDAMGFFAEILLLVCLLLLCGAVQTLMAPVTSVWANSIWWTWQAVRGRAKQAQQVGTRH